VVCPFFHSQSIPKWLYVVRFFTPPRPFFFVFPYSLQIRIILPPTKAHFLLHTLRLVPRCLFYLTQSVLRSTFFFFILGPRIILLCVLEPEGSEVPDQNSSGGNHLRTLRWPASPARPFFFVISEGRPSCYCTSSGCNVARRLRPTNSSNFTDHCAPVWRGHVGLALFSPVKMFFPVMSRVPFGAEFPLFFVQIL